ncbi:MAG: Stp1/IreP family PP2C-type Ser/Thr phosphatase [Sedimentisphaerales bacterium]|nr:Stp1/IreP family PP2C-type Ser/Thr phosphatase [Sedimentisphaerales bacterium]
MAEIVENTSTENPPTHFRWAAETHVGKVRQENEDSYFADPETAIFLVSDGMGGHRGGALASGIVVEDLPVMIENALDKLKVGTPRTIKKILEKAIAEQSKQLQLEGTSESGYKDMGATLVLALLRKGRCYIANIGDSRAYRFRKDRLVQLTQDHSVISELIEKGHIEPEEAVNHDAQGVITRYVGMEEKAHPHVHSFTLRKGDRIFLCTDGLTDMVPDDGIGMILKTETDPQKVCSSLIADANMAGGHDNVTTLLIDWLGST